MKLESIARRLATQACAVLLMMAGTASAAELHVMISAGFSEAYSDIAPAFERATGHRLVTVRGPSMGDSPETIPSRLKRGEPADLVIMVGAGVDDLDRQGLVKVGSKVDLARSLIGMVVRAGAAKPDITSVEAFRHALLDAKSIAYSDSASGLYLSNTLFPRLGVADQVAGKSRKIKGPPSGEPVAAVVARGEAEIGFQQVSELLHASGILYVGPIPAVLQQETFYSAAIAAGAKQSDAASALIRFLVSPEAAPAMLKSGLAPLAAR
jgi:molybdate transport system substrate-binding protein